MIAAQLEALPGRQTIVAIAIAVAILLLVLELVRRRKLREEYSWVWVLTSIALIVLATNQGMLVWLSHWIGAASTVSTLFLGALLFLLAVALQFSVRLSRLTHRNRTLAQRLALLEEEMAKLRGDRTPQKRELRSGERDEVA